MAISVETIIKAGLVVGVIVIFLVALWYLVPPLYADWMPSQVSPELKQQYEDHLENFAENVRACKMKQESNCVCEGFPESTFPGTFKGKLYLISEGRNMKLELKIGTSIISSETIDNVYITGVLVQEGGLNFDIIKAIDVYAEKWIDFDKQEPLFDRKGLGSFWTGSEEPKVVDSRIYKDEQGIIYLLLAYDENAQIRLKLSELKTCT